MGTLNAIGSVASILGLVATIIAVCGIRKIKKYYTIRATMPGFLKQLEQYTTELFELQENFDSNQREIRHLLLLIIGILGTIKTVTTKEVRSNIQKACKLHKQQEQGTLDADKTLMIYSYAQTVFIVEGQNQRTRQWQMI